MIYLWLAYLIAVPGTLLGTTIWGKWILHTGKNTDQMDDSTTPVVLGWGMSPSIQKLPSILLLSVSAQ